MQITNYRGRWATETLELPATENVGSVKTGRAINAQVIQISGVRQVSKITIVLKQRNIGMRKLQRLSDVGHISKRPTGPQQDIKHSNWNTGISLASMQGVRSNMNP
jgi:hypothetical protein